MASQAREAADVDPAIVRGRASGKWWDVLASTGTTLLVTREYEHLVVALSAAGGQPRLSFFPLPHPSGLVVDRTAGRVHVASTRNPNQLFEFAPVAGELPRLDTSPSEIEGRPLVPIRSRLLPGSLYLHDLAIVGGELVGNAVGHNAVVRMAAEPLPEPVWWPRTIDTARGPLFGRNHLQLNSIAAGATIADSFFSASTDVVGPRRPGHLNFPVDGRGVVFSGRTRDVIARGLTRPHSARLHRNRLWVANSGYGELGTVEKGHFVNALTLPGWTRGLCFRQGIAFVGTSRVIPKFRVYAPGVSVEQSVCAVHAVRVATGEVLGSYRWLLGNQIFAIDWIPTSASTGFPFLPGRRNRDAERRLFYGFVAG